MDRIKNMLALLSELWEIITFWVYAYSTMKEYLSFMAMTNCIEAGAKTATFLFNVKGV